MVKIGFIHSISGTMSVCEKPLAEAGIMAVEEINALGGILGHQIGYVLEDGASSPEVFAKKARHLIVDYDAAALFGGWNSHTRKAVRPIVEQYNSSFWYPMSYEGLEASPNIFYTGSTINQQVIPAIEWCIVQGFRSYYLLGSDYIFPITTNKLVRSMLMHNHLEICREIYQPLGHSDFRSTIRDIEKTSPDIVINTLNGDSNLAFFRQLSEAGLCKETLPVLSSSIAEPESKIIGEDSLGHYACWTYFESIDTEINHAFCRRYKARFGADEVVSDPIVMAYSQLFMWKQAVEAAGSFDTDAVRRDAVGQTFDIPPGRSIMCANQHLTKRAYIGRVSTPGKYDIVYESPEMVEPLPWLGVEKQDFNTSHLIIDILSHFPDAVDFNQCLQYQIAQKTADLRHTLDKLHQAEKMNALGELAGGIAHDFNNILGGILGYADLLSESVRERPTDFRYVNHIINAAERARNLIIKILTFSKREHQQKKDIFLKPIMEEVTSLLLATFPATVAIHKDFADESTPIVGDGSTIHEIFLNIATNALHAMDESGNLHFRSKEVSLLQPQDAVHGDIPSGKYSVVEIEDDGSGIADDVSLKMFEPFFSTKTEKNGTGLGLSVVYGAMKEHGGFIQVETEVGKGTLFRLYFPRTDAAPVDPQLVETTIELPALSILLVDDEPVLRQVSAMTLNKLGFKVETCDTGMSAMARFQRGEQYDLLITDQSMPGMSGMELARFVLEMKPDFPIILCSGYSSKTNREKALKSGIRSFLYKPVRKAEWRRVISEIFKSQGG